MHLTFTEPTAPRYIYINRDANLVHLLVPLVGGEEISTDNTCKAKKSLNAFFSGAASHSLNQYKEALEFDLALLAPVSSDYVKKKARLKQIQIYIDSVDRMRRSYDIAIDALMTRPLLNLYGIQLRPRIVDSASRVINPVFNIVRANDAQGTPLSALYNLMQSNYPYLITQPDPSERLKIRVAKLLSVSPSPSFKRIQNTLQQQCSVMFGLRIDFEIQANGNPVTQDSIDTLMGFENNASTEDYIDALIGACALNAWDGLSHPLFYSISSGPVESRTEKLSILTQFFLAHLNIYCKANRISSKNFGQVLDAQPALSHQLIIFISQALNKGDDIEQKISEFFNEHRNEFGLQSPLHEQDVIAIKEKFARTYAMITATNENPHMDDFLILDKEAKGVFAPCVTHQASICVNFAEIVDGSLPNQDFFAQIRNDFLNHPAEIPHHNKDIAGGIDLEPQALRSRLTDAQFATLPREMQELCRGYRPLTSNPLIQHPFLEQKHPVNEVLLDVLQPQANAADRNIHRPNPVHAPDRMNLNAEYDHPPRTCKVNKLIKGSTSFILGGLLGSGLLATAGALAGIFGALILDAASEEDYPYNEAAQIGALGTGVLGALMGGAKAVYKTSLMEREDYDSNTKKSCLFFPTLVTYTATTTVGGLIGWALMNNNGETVMTLAQTAKALSVGGVVSMIPISLMCYCICLPIVMAIVVCGLDYEREHTIRGLNQR